MLLTGINLPQGATVYSVTNWYSVAFPGTGPRFQLMRQDLEQNKYGYLSYKTTAEVDGKRRMVIDIVPAAMRKVDNAKFSYYYFVCRIEGNNFSGARIRYFYKSAGD